MSDATTQAPGRVLLQARGVTKAYKLKVHACTASAKSKIEAAGGSVDLI